MALKSQTQTAPAPTESAPVSVPAVLNTAALFNLPAPQVVEDLLPQLKIVYPIEVDGDKFKPADAYQAGLFDGKQFVKLAAPYTLTVIAAREGSRKLVVDAEGKKSYERAFKAIGEYNASDPVFQQHLLDAQAEKGYVYVLACIRGNDVALCELPAFKLMKDYWGRPLFQALAQNRLGLRVDITDHSANLVTAKNDATKKYLGPQKFRQHAVVELTDDQMKAVGNALTGAKAKFDAWLKR